MFRMINPVREYAWGSTTAFSELFGWAASASPQAEIWMGAHPADPSRIEVVPGSAKNPGQLSSVPEYLRRDDRTPGSFPFLLKVLAAERPLSIQAHPTEERARLGFAAEEAAGIALDSPQRSYKDPHSKPEVVVALTEFSALCGFRPYAEAAAELHALDEAAAQASASAAETSGAPQLRTVLAALGRFMAAGDHAGALEHLLRSHRVESAAAAGELHRLLTDAPSLSGLLSPELEKMLTHVSAAFPQDPGIFVTLLLNRVTLQPGESVYLPAGNLHAYLHGVGVELMGNSDNVLRGGLTSKHLDIDELLGVTDCAVLAVPHCPVTQSGSEAPGARRIQYDAPFQEFQLERIEFPGEAVLEESGHGIVLCTAGELTLSPPTVGGASAAAPGSPRMLTLTPGESAFLPDTAGHRVSASAHAQAFVATTASLSSQDQEHARP